MEIAKLKSRLIRKIENTQDSSKLEALEYFLDNNLFNLQLTDEIKKAIDLGLEDLRNGKILTSEQAEEQIQNWL